MTSKYLEVAGIRINTWITASLRNEGIIPLEVDYVTNTSSQLNQTLPFLIPGQQVQELETNYTNKFNDLPYGVYTLSNRYETDRPWINRGQTTFNFYSGKIDTLITIGNYIYDLCKREDWSAADCNQYFADNDITNPFDFKTISFVTSAGPLPSEDEGGRQMSVLIIRYESTYEGTGRTGVEWNAGGQGMY